MARKDLVDEPVFVKYLWAMHWATQTVTTVGFGDIPAYTVPEICLSLVWMLVGVIFYSFIVGNFTSIIAGNSELQQSIKYRINGLADLSRRAQIPYSLSKRMKQFIENNYQSLFS